eukprot:8147296-Pyramimonas_sp.AAC.1
MPTEMPVDLTQLRRTSSLRTLIETGTKDQLGQSLTWEFNDQTLRGPPARRRCPGVRAVQGPRLELGSSSVINSCVRRIGYSG